MISNFIKKIFGSRNGRILKEYAPLVKKVNELEQIQIFKDKNISSAFAIGINKINKHKNQVFIFFVICKNSFFFFLSYFF